MCKKRMICDQLVKCMETHNENVLEGRLSLNNEKVMMACVELLLKRGRVPTVTFRDMACDKMQTMRVTRSRMLREKCEFSLYTMLSFEQAGKDDTAMEYAKIASDNKALAI